MIGTRNVLTQTLCALLLTGVAAVAQAQNTKAYAPQDLTRLNVPDRVRVIEREYSEQSRGRRIPDDQLEFYLDQVDSGWSWAQIQQDIATSLRGEQWRVPISGWRPTEVTCTSESLRYTECDAPFRGRAVLTYQFSARPCVEGQTWGQQRGVIWVDAGCRGQFAEAGRSVPPPPPPSYVGVVCESREGKRRRCRTDFRGPAVLSEQYSDRPCIEGQTWGWGPGEVWVSQGCRGLFEEGRGRGGGRGVPVAEPQGYSISCSSDEGRQRTCAWNASYGRPVLIEQVSRQPCVEGDTWGYDRNGVWVDRGCRGVFGSR
jgi:hypothetical protein